MAVAAAAAVVLSLARQTSIAPVDTIWAEDGGHFLTDAANRSVLGAVFTSYGGYFQVSTRVLVEPISWLPATWAAPSLAIGAALVNALYAVLIYVVSATALRSRILRLVAAAVAVLPAVGMAEVMNNFANAHWSGLYALFWLALYRPPSPRAAVVAVVAGAAASFANILVVAFLPLLLVQVVLRRERYSVALAGVAVAGFALDAIGLLTGQSRRDGLPLDFGFAIGAYFSRVLSQTMVGEGTTGMIDRRLTPVALWVGLGILVVFLAVGVYRRRRANLGVAALAFAQSALFWTIAGGTGGMSPRYAACAGMLIIGGLAALLTPAPPGAEFSVSRAGRCVDRFAIAVFALGWVALTIVNFAEPNGRSLGPRWSQQIAAAKVSCANAPPGALIAVAISPPTWVTTLPCWYVLR